MAKILGQTIPCLVFRRAANGAVRYYWQPSSTLAQAGWKPVALGSDMKAAIAAAEAQNERIAAWRHGGATPKAVTRHVERATVSALIAGYKKDERFTRLAANTQRVYASALNTIERWATLKRLGDAPAAWITADRVKVLKKALMKPDAAGKVGHHRAHNILRVLRTLYAYGIAAGIVDTNPAVAFDLATPPPRDQIWDYADVAAFRAAAIRIGYPSLGFAVELAEYIGQRFEDIIKLQASQWREVPNLDPEQHRQLAGADGRVMGVFIRQGKTKRWVGVPIAGTMRAAIEAAIATNAARAVPVTTILAEDKTGRPWTLRYFQRKFEEAHDRAMTPTAADRAAGVEPHPALEGLQFRDLRRTCVVRLGELGLEDALIAAITGHKLESVKKILEVYMPRTTKMAARAIVARIGQNAPAKPSKQTA